MNDAACIPLEAINLCKSFDEVSGAIDVLRHVNLKVESGDFICILGASGSGKSTLLHLLARTRCWGLRRR